MVLESDFKDKVMGRKTVNKAEPMSARERYRKPVLAAKGQRTEWVPSTYKNSLPLVSLPTNLKKRGRTCMLFINFIQMFHFFI